MFSPLMRYMLLFRVKYHDVYKFTSQIKQEKVYVCVSVHLYVCMCVVRGVQLRKHDKVSMSNMNLGKRIPMFILVFSLLFWGLKFFKIKRVKDFPKPYMILG